MKLPQFELTRVYEDGTREPPQIVRVAQIPWDTQTAASAVFSARW